MLVPKRNRSNDALVYCTSIQSGVSLSGGSGLSFRVVCVSLWPALRGLLFALGFSALGLALVLCAGVPAPAQQARSGLACALVFCLPGLLWIAVASALG